MQKIVDLNVRLCNWTEIFLGSLLWWVTPFSSLAGRMVVVVQKGRLSQKDLPPHLFVALSSKGACVPASEPLGQTKFVP